MSRRVFVHIGLPKTGTSYLQAILWPAREQLRSVGLLLPGARKADHLFASMVVRDDPGVRRRGPDAPAAWDRVSADVAAWGGDALVSHEFFCAATAEQARRMVDQLAPAEVHVVVTAREPLGLFTSSWQESLKNKSTTPLRDYGQSVSEDPRDVWDWRALDLGLVLERWAPAVPAERVHVICPGPPGSPRELLWERFAAVLGLDPAVCDATRGFANASMGVVEAETLRRINAALPAYSGHARGAWIRSFLADERLVPRQGEPFWPADDQVADCRERGRRAVEMLRASAYDVVGDPDLLLVPDDLPPRRHPDDVTDAEVAACAVDLVATLMGDLRERAEKPRNNASGPPRPSPMSRLGRVLRRAAMRQHGAS
ncbi:hypothetical protein DDE18_07290 [Nocardioides gansuensis]|uniref:Sulfotransferase family protein n=1 Tax=Nocardioides gansuensis TaxID=2138300 RepID=A0A2T8FBQ5_9ACTN|nr:hypothetical protein [Nocardioides gansuensis]PVG83123.1 hypothetical protein DDE18_07290 [Nocardioides gansuensis]